jgi:cell division inhibitor SepF
MSMWARTLVYLGLREEPDDAVDWQVIEDVEPQDLPVEPSARPAVRPTARPTPAAGSAAAAPRGAAPAPSRSASGTASGPATSNVRSLRAGLDVSSERVAVVQVRVFDDVEAIGSRYRLRHPVLFDVSACTREVARRTVDFVAGLTYASHGTLRRTAPRAFLLVPEGLDISLDERRRLAQLGYDVEGIAR